MGNLDIKVNLHPYYQGHLSLHSRKPDFARTGKEKLAKEQNVDLSREDEIIYTQRGLKMFFFVKWQTYRFIVNMWVRFLSHLTSKPAA